jgi:hypothetical protein
VEQVQPNTGEVVINGGDSREPEMPFRFAWGDGEVTESFFPAAHTYADTRRTYQVTVTAHYQDGSSDVVTVLVHFEPLAVAPSAVDPSLRVSVPATPTTLGTRLYPPPSGLLGFPEGGFTSISRASAEQLLSVAAQLQYWYASGDVVKPGGNFRQVVLRDPNAGGGMYSLWFTNPVSFAVGGEGFRFPSGVMGMFHEMGHNVSLNSPAGFQFGGRIDGNANAIFSETMAQIFSYVTAYDLIRDGENYGLDCAVRQEIATMADRDAGRARFTYEQYISGGLNFTSWNDPESEEDDTFLTFGTLAYIFLTHTADAHPVKALQETMALLQTFDAELLAAYDPAHDTEAADTFRSTLMVAAISEGFDLDLRNEFRELGFPIDDATYSSLRERR